MWLRHESRTDNLNATFIWIQRKRKYKNLEVHIKKQIYFSSENPIDYFPHRNCKEFFNIILYNIVKYIRPI